jgi:hypothetical protein
LTDKLVFKPGRSRAEKLSEARRFSTGKFKLKGTNFSAAERFAPSYQDYSVKWARAAA